MGKKISDLINPSETLNSVLDECTDSIKSKLIPLNVKHLEGSRTIERGGKTYVVNMQIQILLV